MSMKSNWSLLALLHWALPDLGHLNSAATYASAAPFGLYGSPTDALLTGLALLAQAGVLARALRLAPSHLGRRLRPLVFLAALIVSVVASLLVLQASQDSQVNLLVLDTESRPERTMIQIGLFLTLWAPLLLIAVCFRPGQGTTFLKGLITAPAAARTNVHIDRLDA